MSAIVIFYQNPVNEILESQRELTALPILLLSTLIKRACVYHKLTTKVIDLVDSVRAQGTSKGRIGSS